MQPDLPVEAALLVAPADPDRFGVGALLPQGSLPFSSTLVASQSDPWLSAAESPLWSQRWRSHHVDFGDAGHINAEAGFGPLPLAQRCVTRSASARSGVNGLHAPVRRRGALRSEGPVSAYPLFAYQSLQGFVSGRRDAS